MDGSDTPEITVGQLKQLLDTGEPITLIDVRERQEWDIANLERYGARLVPLSTFILGVSTLDPEADTVVYCRSGSRSASVVDYLKRHGFARVRNLRGGINAWAREIDTDLPTY